jgi:cell cycle arrest protein BUB3
VFALDNLITGSWDRTLRFWDPRSLNTQQHLHGTPERIYALDHVNNNLVVAMASRLFHIYDIYKMGSPAQERESSLKYMTKSLACMPNSEGPCLPSLIDLYPPYSFTKFMIGYATTSVEGQIAVEYFDPSPASQDKKYAFKCHRQTINDVDHVWPVNSLAFQPMFNTFASAGSDGTVSIWDHKVKKCLRQYPKFPGSVAAVAFSCNGTRITVGVSST